MSLNELKANRALVVDKIDTLNTKLGNAITSVNKRLVVSARDEMKNLAARFEALHVTTMSKESSDPGSEENMTLFRHVSLKVDTAVDLADDFLEAELNIEAADTMVRKYEELCALGEGVVKELEQLEKSLEWLKQSKDGDFRADVVVVGANVANSDKGLEKMKELEAFIILNQVDSEKRKEVLRTMQEYQLKIRTLQIRVKSFVSRSAQSSRPTSRAASPRRQEKDPDAVELPDTDEEAEGTGGGFHGFSTDDIEITNRLLNEKYGLPNPSRKDVEEQLLGMEKHTDTGQKEPPERSRKRSSSADPRPRPEVVSSLSKNSSFSRSNTTLSSTLFKPKKMEYPKFGGSLRAYNTFKRDFLEIIEASNQFSPSQMSLLLRNECLQGPPKLLVASIYEYEDIWEKLNEVYDDEGQVVQAITRQILTYKEIPEDDMNGFVEYVEMIEKAYFDLRAYKSTDVLANPVTIQCIMDKCPYWVQQVLTRDMTRQGIPREQEFDFIRKSMVELKKQARKLSKLSSKKPKNHDNKGRGGPRGLVNTAEGEVIAAGVPGVGVATVNLAAGGRPPLPSSSSWKCYVPGCKYSSKHMFSNCRAFKALDATGRGKVVKDKKLCVLCFGGTHDVSTCNKKSLWKPCDVSGCGRWHSRLLHGATTPGLVLAIAGGPTSSDVLLLLQAVPTKAGSTAVVFWDHGSTTALVTYKFAEENNLVGEKCNFELSGVGTDKRVFETSLYMVPLVDRQGDLHYIDAFGIETITSSDVNHSIREAAGVFKEVDLEDVAVPATGVDLLIGMKNVDIMPTKSKVIGGLALFSSIFGSGKLFGGSTRGGAAVSEEVNQLANVVAHTEARGIQMDFLSAEAYGVEVPKRCSTCKGCKECSFKNSQISYEELKELECIEEKLELDVSKARWTTEYCYKEDPGVLADNYGQAFACMSSTTKRLEKRGQLSAYDAQFQENIDRGVFEEVTEEEARSYKGPVNYISIVETFKPGPHSTTPLRLCMNSSMKYQGNSLNDIMMKGPSALNDLLSVTIGFRSHQVAIVKDISKFYQSVHVVDRDKHLRRVLWNPGNKLDKPKIYKTNVVNFGDKQAGCVAQSALRSTAITFKALDDKAANKIRDDTYVDDTVSGDKSLKEAQVVSKNMDAIAAKGGFIYKETIMSGDKNVEDEPRKVLGLGWNSEEDTIFVGTKVNYSAKKKGLKELPDLELEELVEKTPTEITRRMVWRVVLGQYDILGLISVFTVRLKLIMKRLVEECEGVGAKVMWDKAISPQLRDQFLQILSMLLQLKNTQFPRCIVPADYDPDVLPELMIMVDGSQSAFCALAYLRSTMKDGSFQCRLISGKTRVAPTKKISVPRMELMGAITGIRLADTITRGLRFPVGRRWFFTDNSAVLAMIQKPSGSFLEFVGTRVGEIRSKSEPEKEWFWIPTQFNLADMGTRDNVVPEDISPGSSYQCGQPWMNSAAAEWPSTQSPGKLPEEELSAAARINIAVGSNQVEFFSLGKYHTINKAVGVLARVVHACNKFKSKRDISAFEGIEDPDVKEKVENFLLHKHQLKTRLAFERGRLDTLRPLKHQVQAFAEVELIITAGRLGDKMVVGFDKAALPVLMPDSDLARLYMQGAHEVDHGGVDRALQRSRNQVWIVQGRRLAKVVVNNCFVCKYKSRITQGQLMSEIHENRVPPSPIFASTSLDLFGPMIIKDTVKKRTSKECWGVIFVCTVTAAIHLELAEDYSTDSFIMCLRRFMNLRGTPSLITSDPGTQLVAAAKITEQWDYEKIAEWASSKKIRWHVVPTNSQHYNGCAESLVKVTKQQLNQMMKGRSLTKGDMDTLLSDVMQIVNSRPMVRRAGSDPAGGGPITPNHLMLGRATLEVPDMVFDYKANLTKRVEFIQTIKKEFWDKWITQVFPHLVPSYKWRKQSRNLMVGDVVLMKMESKLSNTYKLAVVKEATPGPDGLVRKVDLSYKNVDEGPVYHRKGYKEKVTERSVHNLVVVLPVDWTAEVLETADRHEPRPKEMQN